MKISLFFLFLVVCFISMNKAAKPNIVFFMIDDLGFNDIGYHDDSIQTPVINKLAAEGMILENNYVAPVCTPSRGSLMTGKYSWAIGQHHGVAMPDFPECLTRKYPLLQESLQELGYKTYMLGKWHEGFCNWNCTPNQRGFDDFYGFYNGYTSHFTHSIQGFYDWRHNEEVAMEDFGKYGGYLLTHHAGDTITDHAINNPTDPFYMYFASTTVHSPMEVPGDYLNMYSNEGDFNRMCLKGMVSFTDGMVDYVVKALKETGMYDNTVIIFTSDNGGEAGYSSNYPLRGAKASIWEGGVRVPGFIHSPLMGDSKGKVSYELFHQTDWYPTIMSLAGGVAYEGHDGFDQTNFLFNGGISARTVVPLHFDQYYLPAFGKSAIRSGRWKLIQGFPGLWNGYDTIEEGPNAFHLTHLSENLLKHDAEVFPVSNYTEIRRGNYNFDYAAIGRYAAAMEDNVMLFDMETDPAETTDVSADHPNIVAKLQEEMKPFADQAVPIASVHGVPEANPHHYGGVWTPGWC